MLQFEITPQKDWELDFPFLVYVQTIQNWGKLSPTLHLTSFCTYMLWACSNFSFSSFVECQIPKIMNFVSQLRTFGHCLRDNHVSNALISCRMFSTVCLKQKWHLVYVFKGLSHIPSTSTRINSNFVSDSPVLIRVVFSGSNLVSFMFSYLVHSFVLYTFDKLSMS